MFLSKVFKIMIFLCISFVNVNTLMADDITIINDEGQYYHLKKGDQIMKISHKFYGTHQKWRKILRANPEINPSLLSVGDKIFIPNIKKKHSPSISQSIKNKSRMSAKMNHQETELIIRKNRAQLVNKTTIENDKKGNQTEDKNDDDDDDDDDLVDYDKRMEETEEAQEITMSPELKNKVVPQVKESGTSASKKSKVKKDNSYLELESIVATLKNKNQQLEGKYIKSEQEHQWIRLRMASLKNKEKEFANYKKEKSNLQYAIKELQDELNVQSNQNKTISKNDPIYLPGMLSYSSEQVLKEKNRLLTQKFWVAKNKDIDKCEIKVFSNLKSTKERFNEFIYFLNETLGSSNVFVDPSTQILTLQLSGKAVYGIKTPRVRSKFKKLLTLIGQKISDLPIKSIHILGLTKLDQVTREDGRKISGEYYSLIQSNAIKKHFIENEGWPANILSSGTFGSSLQVPLKSNKRFDMVISLKEFTGENKRSIASVIQEDPLLKNITKDILVKLGEPRFGSVKLHKYSLDINMGQHYFISNFNRKLTKEGKRNLDTILEMFQLVGDSTFQLELSPGSFEEDNEKTQATAFSRLQVIKRYVFEKHSWIKGRIEFRIGNKYRPLVVAKTIMEDRHNKRLTFRVLPTSIHIREVREPASVENSSK